MLHATILPERWLITRLPEERELLSWVQQWMWEAHRESGTSWQPVGSKLENKCLV